MTDGPTGVVAVSKHGRDLMLLPARFAMPSAPQQQAVTDDERIQCLVTRVGCAGAHCPWPSSLSTSTLMIAALSQRNQEPAACRAAWQEEADGGKASPERCVSASSAETPVLRLGPARSSELMSFWLALRRSRQALRRTCCSVAGSLLPCVPITPTVILQLCACLLQCLQ